jgi:hypothetical protein
VADEPAHVLPPHQRHVLPEPGAVEIVAHAAVVHFLGGHLFEHLCGIRKTGPQPLGEVAVDAAVLLFVADGEREDFLLGEIGKALHRSSRVNVRKVELTLLPYQPVFVKWRVIVRPGRSFIKSGHSEPHTVTAGLGS